MTPIHEGLTCIAQVSLRFGRRERNDTPEADLRHALEWTCLSSPMANTPSVTQQRKSEADALTPKDLAAMQQPRARVLREGRPVQGPTNLQSRFQMAAFRP